MTRKTIELADNCTVAIYENGQREEAAIRVEIYARGSVLNVTELFEILRNAVVYSVCKEARISDGTKEGRQLWSAEPKWQ